MSHPAVQRATHRIYGMLSWVGTPLPLPLAPMVAPTPAEECVVAVTFFQGRPASFGEAYQAVPRGMGRQLLCYMHGSSPVVQHPVLAAARALHPPTLN